MKAIFNVIPLPLQQCLSLLRVIISLIIILNSFSQMAAAHPGWAKNPGERKVRRGLHNPTGKDQIGSPKAEIGSGRESAR
jgi:hypothetical protein